MDFITLSKFAELWAPDIKSVPISKKGTPLISFSFATEIYELTSSIFFKLKKLLITSALILNSFPILIKISLSPISRPSIKYDWYIFSLISLCTLDCSANLINKWENTVLGVFFILSRLKLRSSF